MMKTLIKAEFYFLKHLATQKQRITGFKGIGVGNGKKLLLLISVYLLADIVVTLMLFYPIDLLFPEIEQAYAALDDFTETEFLLMAVFLAPPLEEFLFRLPLRYSRRNLKVWLFFTMLFTFVIHYIIGILLLILWVNLLAYGDKRHVEVKIKRFYKKQGVWIFWFFTLLFAAVHISNFNLQELPIYLYAFAIVPQIIAGIVLGIVRLRFGFWWAILHHALFNLVVSL